MKPDDAKALLASVQQLRTHWSWIIITQQGFAISIVAGIWSYFGKAFIDSLNKGGEPLYLMAGGALSCLILGLWRLSARGMDNHIARLYPEFVLFEGTLHPADVHGICAFLRDNVPGIIPILTLPLEQRVEAVRILVNSRQIGRRGHRGIDIWTFVFQVTPLLASLALMNTAALHSNIYYVTVLIMCLGVTIHLYSFLAYQGDLTNACVRGTLKKVKREE